MFFYENSLTKVWIIKDFIKSEFKLNDEDDDHKFVWPILLPHIFCADSLPAQRNIVMSLMKLLLMRNLFSSEKVGTASARSHLTYCWNPSTLGWYWAGALTMAITLVMGMLWWSVCLLSAGGTRRSQHFFWLILIKTSLLLPSATCPMKTVFTVLMSSLYLNCIFFV